ncbi:MAG: hypothetical protein ASARMPREDX12_006318 [Alectoria sarmentosa]|nr:MAG: hypothetical protein ASARMPREDX12_006318 [Alectoria sarmentosa]
MSFNHYHDDFKATESFEMPRILEHDDFEDNHSVKGPVTDPEVPTFVLRAGLDDARGHMPMPGVKCPRCAERGIEQERQRDRALAVNFLQCLESHPVLSSFDL